MTASRGEREAGDVPVRVVVVDPQAPEAGVDLTVADLVSRQVPSLNLLTAASGLITSPRDQSVNIRGAGSGNVSHVLLLVDGLPVLDPYNTSAIWSKTPLGLVDRVEVVPGGGATVWGNQALSGVVNLITRAPSARAIDVTARLAARRTTSLTASFATAGERWRGWIAGDDFSTDGYVTQEAAARGPVDEAEFRNFRSINAKAIRALTPDTSVQLRALGYRERRGEGTRLDRAQNDEWLAAVAVDRVVDPRETWQVQAFGRRQSLDDASGGVDAARTTLTPRAHIRDLTSENYGASLVWNRVLAGGKNLAAGADYQSIRVDREEDLEFDGGRFVERSLIEGEQQLVGGFVEWRRQAAERWSLQAAARFDAIRTSEGRSRRVDLTTSAPIEDARLRSHTETTVNPTLGFVYQATATSRWRAAAYTGFRSPAPSELFVGAAPRNNRVRLPNPELRPEKLTGAELGYDYTPSRRALLHATVFWSETDDLVQVITVGRVGSDGGFVEPCGPLGPRGSCQQRRNIGTSRARGVELESELRPHPRWSFRFAGSLLEADVVSNPPDPSLVGNQLEQTPRQRVTVGVDYRDPSAFVVGLRARHTGARFAEAENENRLPAFTVFDLSLSYPVSPRLELTAGVENLLDEKTRVDAGSSGFRVGPPRLLQVGLRFRAGDGR